MILCKIIRKDLNILGEIKFSELLLIFKPLGILIKYQYKKSNPNTIFPLLNICYLQKNWVFATNSNALIPISLQHDGVNLWYLKLRFFDQTKFVVWNI